MSLLRYPKYRESGIDWLGEVPEHWGVASLKRGFEVRLGKMLQTDKSSADDTLLPYLRAANIHWKGVELDDVKSMWFSLRDREQLLLNAGDLLVSEGGDVGRSAIWCDTGFDCYIQNSVNRIRARYGNSTKFLYYWMSTIKDKGYVDVLCNKSTIAHFTAEKVAEVPVPFPAHSEQKSIAAFLDRETAIIDALISEQEKLITLLAEKRQATISHAVTKGLNPDAPMKNSGVEWLGEIPENWEVAHLKRFCDLITDGAHISPETENGIFHFVSTKDVNGDKINFDGALLTSELNYDYLVKNGCKPRFGDVLFSKDGTIGRTVVVSEEKEFVVASSLIIIRPNERMLDSCYLNYLCKSSVVSQQVDGFVKGAGLPRLSIQNILKVLGVFPPLQEQRNIAAFLETEVTRFSELSYEAGVGIILLKERRSALISAAVTGKIDVRHAVQQESAIIQEAA